MKIMQDEALEKLSSTKLGRDHLEGIHTYDILANHLYLDDFQYFSPAIEGRERFIIDDDADEQNDCAQSDLVKMVLSLAFMTEDRAESFTFHKDTYKNVISGKLLGSVFKKISVHKQNDV